MNSDAIERAASLLVRARRDGVALPELPDGLRPTTFADAHAIQDAVTASLGDSVAGWKVFTPDGGTCRGSMLSAVVMPSPGALPSGHMRTRGVEGEVAFRFLRDLPPRAAPYTRDEVAEAVAAGPAIEVVETRFQAMNNVSWPERVADHFCNGGFVYGTFREDWQSLDFTTIPVRVTADGVTIFEDRGGHAAGDPLLPAVALVNLMRQGEGVKAGRIVTTGSFTGMRPSRVGEHICVEFTGLGSVKLCFVP